MAYDPRLVGVHYLPRFAPLLPLTLAVVVLGLVRRRGRTALPRGDVLDVLALAFAAWQAVSAEVSPSPALAWFGFYNRGTGALFWIALALLFVAARRLLDGRCSRQMLTWAASLVLVAAGVIALAQVAGAPGLWGGAVVDGRAAGPVGNPIALAGLCLLGVWLAAGLSSWPAGSATRVAAVAGAVGGATCLVLTVSRAAYLGVAVGAATLAVTWVLERRRRALAILAISCAAVLVATLGYGLALGGDGGLLSRIGEDTGGLTRSDSLRLVLWREGIAAVAWRPTTGAGSGAFAIVDRLYRPADDRMRRPWALSSDPHSLPLLVASTSGVPGLLLAVVFAVMLVRRVWRRQGTVPGGEDGDRELAGERRLAGLAYLAAATVFALVSPLDLALAVPAALVAAVTCGAPEAPRRLSLRLPDRLRRAGATAFTAAGVAAACAGLIVAVVGGVQSSRADRVFAESLRTRSSAGVEKAASLWSWEPFYALEAGAEIWREGLAGRDAGAIARGRALLRRGIARDPTAALGYLDLARLDIAVGKVAEAVGELRAGLRWNPHHPMLQGRWGYAALVAQTQTKDEPLASELLSGLRSLPADSPDAWFWISGVLAARGDTSGAVAARTRARELAPELQSRGYRERLLNGR